MKPKLEENLILKIDSLAFGNGAGVARHNGMVVFVAGGCPGDEVTAKITLVKKNFAEAIIKEINVPSPSRITPPCPVAGDCGGCSWQHVDYQTQLQQKDGIIQKNLTPILDKSTQLNSIIPSPKKLNYRNRIQLHKKGAQWGYYKSKSSEIVAIDSCMIAENDLNEHLVLAKKDSSLPNTCRVELQSFPNGNVEHSITAKERDEIGFSQVNSAINDLLVDKLVTLTGNLEFHNIHDLYAGNGNFSFPLAQKHPEHKVFSVELNRKAHEDAFKLCQKIKPSNLQLIHAPVETYLKSALVSPDDLTIVDPPRAGLQKTALEQLVSLSGKHLIYISCDPMTLKRDLVELIRSAGFRVSWVQPFDMFPQTPHMEVMVHLVR